MKMTSRPEDLTEDDEFAQLKGIWLYGGMLYEHFGHFLVESMSRLWMLEHLPEPIDGVLYLPKERRVADADIIEHSEEMLREFLGADLTVKAPLDNTEVEGLVIPEQGFGLGEMVRGTPEFRDFARNNYFTDVAPKGADKIYLSRSELSPDCGRYLGEKKIEELFEANGYEIYHPQNHSIAEQVAQYKKAKMIVSSDGSALHLAAFFVSPETNVGIVRRRYGPQYRFFIDQLDQFQGRKPVVLSMMEPEVYGATDGGQRRSSFTYTVLRADELMDELLDNGFISVVPEDWDLTDEDIDADRLAIAEALGQDDLFLLSD